MGGNVALELAARYPDIPSSLVMIDSVMLPPQALLNTLHPLIEALQEQHYLAAYQHALSVLCLPTDKRPAQLISSLQVRKHVLASAIPNHTTSYDAAAAASACRIPIAYILSTMPFLDLPRFQSLTTQLMIARTLGSGHFSPIEVPDQINAMIARFIMVN
jgi:pimeloyl-ACP methyl ester carboxylesterase